MAPEWKAFFGMLGENWAVIMGSLPLFLTILATGMFVTYLITHRLTKAFYAQEVKTAKEVTTAAEKLRDLAKEREDIAKTALSELEKKFAERNPPQRDAPPPDVLPVIKAKPAVREAFEQLNSTQGLHLPFDPRETGEPQLYVSITTRQLQDMAAAGYFADRGLIGVYKPDTMGTGVTITASSSAAEAFTIVNKWQPNYDPKKGGGSTSGSA